MRCPNCGSVIDYSYGVWWLCREHQHWIQMVTFEEKLILAPPEPWYVTDADIGMGFSSGDYEDVDYEEFWRDLGRP